jgi:hypothetical protein
METIPAIKAALFTFRDIVHVLQSVGGALEGGKGLQLDHLAKLCEISGSIANIGELGTNLFRFQTLKESIPGGALVQEVVDLVGWVMSMGWISDTVVSWRLMGDA